MPRITLLDPANDYSLLVSQANINPQQHGGLSPYFTLDWMFTMLINDGRATNLVYLMPGATKIYIPLYYLAQWPGYTLEVTVSSDNATYSAPVPLTVPVAAVAYDLVMFTPPFTVMYTMITADLPVGTRYIKIALSAVDTEQANRGFPAIPSILIEAHTTIPLNLEPGVSFFNPGNLIIDSFGTVSSEFKDIDNVDKSSAALICALPEGEKCIERIVIGMADFPPTLDASNYEDEIVCRLTVFEGFKQRTLEKTLFDPIYNESYVSYYGDWRDVAVTELANYRSDARRFDTFITSTNKPCVFEFPKPIESSESLIVVLSPVYNKKSSVDFGMYYGGGGGSLVRTMTVDGRYC